MRDIQPATIRNHFRIRGRLCALGRAAPPGQGDVGTGAATPYGLFVDQSRDLSVIYPSDRQLRVMVRLNVSKGKPNRRPYLLPPGGPAGTPRLESRLREPEHLQSTVVPVGGLEV